MKPKEVNEMVTRIILCLLFACLPLFAAEAQDVSSDKTPHGAKLPYAEGYYGVGHEDWHDIYSKLHNQKGTHCCNNNDCRPTVAKFENGKWYAKVQGVWMYMEPSRNVQEYKYSWSDTPHVCVSPDMYIFCFVPPNASG